ncbi:hypothetical protein PTKIN_Ptkin02bG0196700 [Pterospermum kingtungense]
MVFESDRQSLDNCRMDRRTFAKLCHLVRTIGGLKETKHMSVEEMVVNFLHIIAHHTKNRVIKSQVVRSGETISRQFNVILNSILRLHSLLFKKPMPIGDNSTNSRWKWFKGCLGALDGTYIQVNVFASARLRFRTRKNEIAANVLGVCTPDMQFVYVLPDGKDLQQMEEFLEMQLVGERVYRFHKGHKPGIYNTWDEANRHIHGYPNAKHKKFMDIRKAEAAFAAHWGINDNQQEEETSQPNTTIIHRKPHIYGANNAYY